MNKILAGLLVLVIFFITACNNNNKKNHQGHKMDNDSMSPDKMQMDTMKDMKNDTMKDMKMDTMSGMDQNSKGSPKASTVSEITISPTNIGDKDPAVKKFINTLTSQYLSIKNGLIEDNVAAAKTGASTLNHTIKTFDNSFFTARQKIEFDKHSVITKDQLQGIASANTLQIQRASFNTLSQHIYELIKTFGPGQVLYHDHCPMAFNNQGAIWLSETKEINNPYLGKQMASCGSIKEIIN